MTSFFVTGHRYRSEHAPWTLVFQCISFGGFADAELLLVLLCGMKLSEFQAFQHHPLSLLAMMMQKKSGEITLELTDEYAKLRKA